MIKQFAIAFCLWVLAGCGSPSHRACTLVEVSDVSRENVVRQSGVTVIQTMRAVHDTLAPDLHLVIKDSNGRNLPGLPVSINGGPAGITDEKGEVHFIAFSGNEGRFNIMINKDHNDCIQLKGLPFRSGEIRGFDVVIGSLK